MLLCGGVIKENKLTAKKTGIQRAFSLEHRTWKTCHIPGAHDVTIAARQREGSEKETDSYLARVVCSSSAWADQTQVGLSGQI